MDSITEKQCVIDNLIDLHVQQKQIFTTPGYHHHRYEGIINNRIPPMYPTDINIPIHYFPYYDLDIQSNFYKFIPTATKFHYFPCYTLDIQSNFYKFIHIH